MKYFTIDEFTITGSGLPNVPNGKQIANIEKLVEKVLDPARDALGEPVGISSGFRSPDINKYVKGAKNSQHLSGEAADIYCFDNMKLFKILIDMEFDQLIYEHGDDKQPSWIHVSYREGNNRQQVLRARKSGKKTVYEQFKI